jgi:hypothetical protein
MQSTHGHQRQIFAVPACFKVKMARVSVREKRFFAYEKRGLVGRKWRGEFFTKRGEKEKAETLTVVINPVRVCNH